MKGIVPDPSADEEVNAQGKLIYININIYKFSIIIINIMIEAVTEKKPEKVSPLKDLLDQLLGVDTSGNNNLLQFKFTLIYS